jgi:hypothetical protein
MLNCLPEAEAPLHIRNDQQQFRYRQTPSSQPENKYISLGPIHELQYYGTYSTAQAQLIRLSVR